MVQGFFGNIGNALGGIGSKLGGALSTAGNKAMGIVGNTLGKVDTGLYNLGQGVGSVGKRVGNAFANSKIGGAMVNGVKDFAASDAASILGNAALGGGLEFLGQKLNEPYRHNLITASYYGNRYTPHLEKPDEQWGQKMTQGIQGIMSGEPVDPNKEKEEEQSQQQQQQPQQQGGGDDDDEEKAAKARAAFYSVQSNNYAPVEFSPLNSYSGRYA